MPEAVRQREMGMERTERVYERVGRAVEKVRVSFPRERLFVRGLYQSQLQKGKYNLRRGTKNGIAEWNWSLKWIKKKKVVMGVLSKML